MGRDLPVPLRASSCSSCSLAHVLTCSLQLPSSGHAGSSL